MEELREGRVMDNKDKEKIIEKAKRRRRESQDLAFQILSSPVYSFLVIVVMAFCHNGADFRV